MAKLADYIACSLIYHKGNKFEIDEEKRKTNEENPLLRVKKNDIEIEVYQGIERYMFFHLMKEWVLDDR